MTVVKFYRRPGPPQNNGLCKSYSREERSSWARCAPSKNLLGTQQILVVIGGRGLGAEFVVRSARQVRLYPAPK
ncbi:unnamed protein product [Trifolium pratense]|uniref:Uncharacterized protein n=1 Tax=Trifolium pratense TaxID=57577 RepID=A0ACB0JQ41_TRIPR|nr:unnamed protein product [Trifolium pratense]